MNLIAVALALILMLPAPRAAAAEEHATVSITILPGPLIVTLDREDAVVVLTVDDMTGSGAGWWASVDCTCAIVPAGDPAAVAGMALDRDGGPRLVGSTLVAERGRGMGVYQLTFRFEPGVWSLTFAQGPRP